MPSLTCFNVRFTPNWLMIILATLFIALFVRLGFWQLERADEKAQMLSVQQTLMQRDPIFWDAGSKAPLQYQKIKIKGTYLPDLLLLDNQHHDHQFGYDVLSPLLLADGRIILIDRGWVPGDNSRRSLPKLETLEKLVEIQGTVYFPNKNQWLLGPESEKKENKITIIEGLDPKIAEQILQKKAYPFIIRLDKQEAHGFVRDWAIVSMPPQRHLAYALQWFAMAAAILVIFIVLNLKKKNE